MQLSARHIIFAGLGLIGISLVTLVVFPWLVSRAFSPSDPAGQPGVSIKSLPIAEPVSNSSPTKQKSLPALPTEETPETTSETSEPAPEPAILTVAEGLTIPWDLAWLPDGTLIVTERPGNLVMLGPNRVDVPIPGVIQRSESGLLGLALHPEFSINNYIYLYITTLADEGLINRVERYQFKGQQLSDRQVIIDNIPGAIFHDGGRLKFGPDNMLYITTGDATEPESAQDINSLAGKILRLTDNGEIPADNPSDQPWISYGHRNPQGITWDEQGNLWSTEHGRSGLQSGLDEVNLITLGSNYGWPDSQGDTAEPGTVAPALHSGPDLTWAPASAEYLNGSIFFGGLRGEALYQAEIKDDKVTNLITHFHREFGRIRTVKLGPDGFLYITTSNQDGRGDVREGDDKILRINPKIFEQ